MILTLILSLYLDNIIPGFIVRGLDNPPVFSSIPTLRFTLIFAPTVAATSMIPQMFHDVRLSIRPALCTEPHACHINDVPISLRLGTPRYLLVSEHFLVRSNTGMMTSHHLGFPRQSLVCFFSFVKWAKKTKKTPDSHWKIGDTGSGLEPGWKHDFDFIILLR